jgi:hypothetical protein
MPQRRIRSTKSGSKVVRFTLELDPILHTKVVAQADSEGMTRAEFIRELCRQATRHTVVRAEPRTHRVNRMGGQ